MERDERLSRLEEQYQRSLSLRPEERITESQYKEQKTRIEWDVAWRVFDKVNQYNNTMKHIDLNCLDVHEACSITKQHIFEIA